jgi:hypothetical protein
LELADCLQSDLSIGEIGEFVRVFREKKSRVVPLSSNLVELIKIFSSFRLLDTILCLHLDSCLFGEYLYRFSEVDLLDLHQEIDRTTSLATGEAMSNILGRRDDKRGTFFTMKRAESLVVDSCLLGRYIPIDDIEYLDARFDVLGEGQGEIKNKK